MKHNYDDDLNKTLGDWEYFRSNRLCTNFLIQLKQSTYTKLRVFKEKLPAIRKNNLQLNMHGSYI